MLLAIDIGNSNTAFGLSSGDVWVREWRMETRHDASANEIAQQIVQGVANWNNSPPPPLKLRGGEINTVIVASVVPPIDEAFTTAITNITGRAPMFVTHKNAGVKIRYPHPEEIGADRLADAAGAIKQYGAPCIVVDFGTATTFDYIAEDGAYCGGPIAPGLKLSNLALAQAAAKLGLAPIAETTHLIPQTTVEAIQAGVFHGYVGLTAYLIEKMKKEVGGNPAIIATGGLAHMIAPHCRQIATVDPRLTLEGLKYIFSGGLQ